MSKRYIFLSVVFIALSLGLVLLPEQDKGMNSRPDLLLLEINSSERFLSTEIIAERIISGDPRLLLVDVRSTDQFDEYHIPGSINLPLNQVLYDSVNGLLNQKNRDIVFYSNANITADQAWILYKQKKYKNLFVLEGGLNGWFKNIMVPTAPCETDSDDAIALYNFRIGASVYFGMNAPIVEYKEPEKPKAKQIIKAVSPPKEVIILQEVEEEEEGC